jgi:hypothetical protein
MRAIAFLTGLGSFVFGLASYVPAIPIPIDCHSITCEIGSAVVSLDLLLMGLGIFLIFISVVLGKS